MRRIALAVIGVFALAACSSSAGISGSPAPPSSQQQALSSSGTSNSSSSPPPAPSSAPAPGLNAQLLTVSDLPSGWAVDNSAGGDSPSTPPCLKNLKSRLDTTDKAQADFVKGTDVPVFEQQLGYYGTSGEALARYKVGTGILDACKDLSFTSDGQKYTGSIGQLSFPKFGEDSEAWRVVLSAGGVTLGIDVAVVHKGSELAVLLYGDLGTPDMSESTALVRRAVAQMP